MTTSWPPSPFVEDEETALAKEHDIKQSLEQLKNNNQQAVAKGSVDQHPIILDSDDNKSDTDSLKTVTPSHKAARENRHSADFPSATKKINLPPTPPSSAEDVRASRKEFDTKQAEARSSTPRSKSTTRLGEPSASKGRPQVTRIQTDVHNIPRMNASARRAPSPYAYTKETGTVRIDPKLRYSGEHFLTPAHASMSPESMKTVQKSDRSSEHRDKTESQHDTERHEARKARFHDESRGSEDGLNVPKRGGRDSTDRPVKRDTTSKSQHQQEPLTPPGSRRQSKESPVVATREERRSTHRESDYSLQQGSRITESPYTSSAEESVKHSRTRDHRFSDNEDRRTRRRSTHRRERPRFEEPLEHSNLQRFRGFSDDEKHHRHRRDTSLRSPLASPVVETPGSSTEDYFARAFQENQKRTQGRSSTLTADESALLSPPTSPPRTPRSERNSQDYFSPMSATVHKPMFRSREPSLEESQIKELRIHSSLLSQATTSAAMAARTAPTLSRSSTATLDTPSNSSSSKPSTRKPSPSYEDEKLIMRPDMRALREEDRASRHPSVSQPSSRPSTRDGPTYHDSVAHEHHMLPPRTSSYSGHDHPYQGPRSMQFGPPLTTTSAMAGALSVPTTPQSPIQRSKSFAAPQEMASTTSEWKMPSCPRSIPTHGYRDWYTFKEFSAIDICPSCVDAVLTTRFRAFLVRSLDKPYNESTVCAMSDPWIRIAFEQSVKQRKYDLKQVKDTSSPLPREVRPCLGFQTDFRKWWGIRDSQTYKPISDFFICSACMMNVDTVFPDLKKTFERDNTEKSRVCCLHPKAKHFEGLIDEFEQANDRCHKNGFRPKYTESLVNYAKRKSQSWGCCRDVSLKNRAWHFMHDLPEFTICEECYKEVVWPLHDKFIARDISKTLKIPSSKVAGKDGASCNLYSDRMRHIFRTAVNARDFDYLKAKVRERLDVQHRLREIARMYEQDRNLGYDRDPDVQRNKDIWKAIE